MAPQSTETPTTEPSQCGAIKKVEFI